jgi:hypothetical protein
MTSPRLAAAFLLAAAAGTGSASESYSVGSTGNLYYEYHFDIPAARGRYQPDLMLRYGGPQGSIGSTGATWAVPPPMPKGTSRGRRGARRIGRDRHRGRVDLGRRGMGSRCRGRIPYQLHLSGPQSLRSTRPWVS